MLGNCAMGRPDIATSPMMTIRMEITIATIGRLMKNFDIGQRLEMDKPFKVSLPPHPVLEPLQYPL